MCTTHLMHHALTEGLRCVSQMIACVGQQSVGGDRIQNGFVDRTLPHFHRGARNPESKGFVASSFYTGLVATEDDAETEFRPVVENLFVSKSLRRKGVGAQLMAECEVGACHFFECAVWCDEWEGL